MELSLNLEDGLRENNSAGNFFLLLKHFSEVLSPKLNWEVRISEFPCQHTPPQAHMATDSPHTEALLEGKHARLQYKNVPLMRKKKQKEISSSQNCIKIFSLNPLSFSSFSLSPSFYFKIVLTYACYKIHRIIRDPRWRSR